MALNDRAKILADYVKDYERTIDYNNKLFRILEGDLLTEVLSSLERQLSPKAYVIAKERVSPINILKKIIDKLSKLYSVAPTRTSSSAVNQELIDMYERDSNINYHLDNKNHNFNVYKNSVLEIYEDPYELAVNFRAIPANQFIPYSDDVVNPLRMTTGIKFMGTVRGPGGSMVKKFHAISANEFLSFTENGDIVMEDMAMSEGINPFGVLPFVYASRSPYNLVPIIDTDTLQMVVLLPVLLTDLNFASEFMSHAIIYGVDINAENLTMSPNQFWELKSDEEGKSPQVGTIEPTVNIEGVLQLIKEQMATWMETRNIRPGTISNLDSSDVASGISLIIREMDTTQDRKEQEVIFQGVENEIWNWKLKIIHNRLVDMGRIASRSKFTEEDIQTKFADQKPIEEKSQVVLRLKEENQAGFTSKRRAIKELNPGITDEEIDELMEEIDEEKGFSPFTDMEKTNNSPFNQDGSEDDNGNSTDSQDTNII